MAKKKKEEISEESKEITTEDLTSSPKEEPKIEEVAQEATPKKIKRGVSVGIPGINELITGGINPGSVILLTGTTGMFLGFFTGSDLGVSVPQIMLYRTLLTPLAIHSFTLGLVTGKIVSGRVSNGFKHATFLSLVSLGGIWAVSNLNLGGGLI